MDYLMRQKCHLENDACEAFIVEWFIEFKTQMDHLERVSSFVDIEL